MDELILGIDLGTTNSEVAVIQDGKPLVLEEDGDPILPSFVGLGPDGKLLVGKAARNQWALLPERTIKSIKRKMGQDVKVRLGEQEFSPQEISAMILRALAARAAARLGRPVHKAVITVPAYFNDAQRQATRAAGELAGLDVVRILNEPTAAALCYDPQQTELRRILVYDLGGGTFDVSIVQAQDGVVEVLASHGDTQLGGDDFDDLLLRLVIDKFKEQHGIDLSTQVPARARLLRAVEAAKRQLSFHPFVRIEEEFVGEKAGQALHLSMEVGRDEYEGLIRPMLERTMDSVQRALDDARLAPRALDQVVLVGGSTRTPLITQLLEERLGQPAHQEVNPDLAVSMGAAIQAGLVAGLDLGAVLVDITPHSLGIKSLDLGMDMDFPFRFSPIVHRNTALPASRSELFCTISDDQPAVDIEVYQGEHDDIRHNHQIGKFRIDGLAKVPAGNTLVVQLDVNLDGMLKVTAREKATGLHKHVTIDNALSRFHDHDQPQAQARIDDLWQTFHDDTGADEQEELEAPAPEPASSHRETVQARALMEKAERLRDTASAEDRAEIDRLLMQTRTALEKHDAGELSRSCDQLSDVLFYLEDA